MPSQDARERARAWIIGESKRPIRTRSGGYRWFRARDDEDLNRMEYLPHSVFDRLESVDAVSGPRAAANAIEAAALAIEAGELDITS